jgi:hypothetical protein
MADLVEHLRGTPVLMGARDGAKISTARDATDLIGTALSASATWVAIPAERLDDAFFQLSTGLAGEIIQKFAQYRLGVAILGDISRHLSASRALTDYVWETNRGRQAWFLRDVEELADRLPRTA